GQEGLLQPRSASGLEFLATLGEVSDLEYAAPAGDATARQAPRPAPLAIDWDTYLIRKSLADKVAEASTQSDQFLLFSAPLRLGENRV
ncbi:MAG: hypothetical protein ACNA7E_02280, partial [Wenzhouxiangellaceae bacterium]